jgi:hypothetical protein
MHLGRLSEYQARIIAVASAIPLTVALFAASEARQLAANTARAADWYEAALPQQMATLDSLKKLKPADVPAPAPSNDANPQQPHAPSTLRQRTAAGEASRERRPASHVDAPSQQQRWSPSKPLPFTFEPDLNPYRQGKPAERKSPTPDKPDFDDSPPL